MKPLLLWLWLAQGADIGTTAAALHQGCVEATYWSSHAAVIAGGKLAATVTFTVGLPHQAKASKVIVTSYAAASTVAALLNVRTLPNCAR